MHFYNFTIINKTVNNFSNIIKLGKDIKFRELITVVYQICCQNCNKYYIGQTSTQIKYRIYEHNRDCNNRNDKSALALHVKNSQHNFDFTNFKILDIENNQQRRLFSEMWHIHKNDNNLNRQFDTLELKDSYKNLIKIKKNSNHNIK